MGFLSCSWPREQRTQQLNSLSLALSRETVKNDSGVQRLNFVRVGVGREGAGGVAAGGQARNAGVAGATDRRANYTNNHTR